MTPRSALTGADRVLKALQPMATVTKKDLIDRITEQTGCKRAQVKDTVQAFLNEVIEELAKGNRLEFRDFGVFEVRERAARMAQNPRTLERVPVPPKKSVKFKVGRLMRDKVETPVEGSGEGEPLEVTVRAGGSKDAAHNGMVGAER